MGNRSQVGEGLIVEVLLDRLVSMKAEGIT